MAATVDVYEFTSASAGVTKTSAAVRFKKANNTTVDALNPLIKPASGQYDRSYFKYIGLYCSVSPAVSLSNLLFWFGTIPSGAEFRYVNQAPASWATPVQALDTDDTMQLADATHASSSTKEVLEAGPLSTPTGIVGNMIKTFLRISSVVAAPGILTGTPLNFSYDEV